MKNKTNKKGKGDAPLWLSTLSALSVLIMCFAFYFIVNQIIKAILIIPIVLFIFVIIDNIKTMVRYKSIKITPNQIKLRKTK